MCNCGAGHSAHVRRLAEALPPPVPGETGFVYLRYTGPDAKTEFGKVTGARYLFWENPVRLVDRRDAEALLATDNFVEEVNAYA